MTDFLWGVLDVIEEMRVEQHLMEEEAMAGQPRVGPLCDTCGLVFYIAWPDCEERPCKCPQPAGSPF